MEIIQKKKTYIKIKYRREEVEEVYPKTEEKREKKNIIQVGKMEGRKIYQ